MSQPKRWDGLSAAGDAGIRALSETDSPYLRTSGPGVMCCKKGEFNEVTLDQKVEKTDLGYVVSFNTFINGRDQMVAARDWDGEPRSLAFRAFDLWGSKDWWGPGDERYEHQTIWASGAWKGNVVYVHRQPVFLSSTLHTLHKHEISMAFTRSGKILPWYLNDLAAAESNSMNITFVRGISTIGALVPCERIAGSVCIVGGRPSYEIGVARMVMLPGPDANKAAVYTYLDYPQTVAEGVPVWRNMAIAMTPAVYTGIPTILRTSPTELAMFVGNLSEPRHSALLRLDNNGRAFTPLTIGPLVEDLPTNYTVGRPYHNPFWRVGYLKWSDEHNRFLELSAWSRVDYWMAAWVTVPLGDGDFLVFSGAEIYRPKPDGLVHWVDNWFTGEWSAEDAGVRVYRQYRSGGGQWCASIAAPEGLAFQQLAYNAGVAVLLGNVPVYQPRQYRAVRPYEMHFNNPDDNFGIPAAIYVGSSDASVWERRELPWTQDCCGKVFPLDPKTLAIVAYTEEKRYTLYASTDFGVTWKPIAKVSKAEKTIDWWAGLTDYNHITVVRDRFGSPANTFPGAPWIGDNRVRNPYL